MKLLITNDDGIDGKGWAPLVKKFKPVTDKLIVLVPDRERSAISQAITLNSPIRMKEVKKDIHTLDGTPTDCVYLTILGALNFTPDIIISGINRGPNLGEDIIYSGTVAAAIEACLANIKTFAISINEFRGTIYYDAAAKIAFDFLKVLKKLDVPRGLFFNINVPNLPYKKIKGLRATKLGSRRYYDKLIKREDPHGNPYFWLKSKDVSWKDEEGTDYDAVRKGYVSITPCHLDLTAYDYLDKLKKIL